IVVSWGVAQWDYVLPETMTVDQAAAPSGTLETILVVTVIAALVIVPAFVLLYVLDQRSLLPGESVDDEHAEARPSPLVPADGGRNAGPSTGGTGRPRPWVDETRRR